MLQELLNAIFSDETELFRSPSEPDPGDTVRIRLRVKNGSVRRVLLYISEPEMAILMHKASSDLFYDFYEAELVCLSNKISYSFIIEMAACTAAFEKTGAR